MPKPSQGSLFSASAVIKRSMAIDWGIGAMPEMKAAKWERIRARGRMRFVVRSVLIMTATMFVFVYLIPRWLPAPFHNSAAFSPITWAVWLLTTIWGGFTTWNSCEARYRLFIVKRDGPFASVTH